MTQNAQVPIQKIEEANSYNANKDYAVQGEHKQMPTADSMFIPGVHDKEAEQKTTTPEQTQDQSQEQTKVEDQDGHDYKKRWSDLKKRYDTEVTKYRQALDEVKESTGTENVKVPQTPAELESFMNDEPKLYELFKGIAKLQVEEDSVDVKQKLTEIENRELKLAKAQAFGEIRKAHDDFDTITESDDFHNWAENQPESIRNMVYTTTTDSSAVIRAIDLYKADVIKLERNESAQTEQIQENEDASSLVSTRVSAEPSTGDQKIWTETEIRNLSMAEYDKRESEIDQAILEGRVRPN